MRAAGNEGLANTELTNSTAIADSKQTAPPSMNRSPTQIHPSNLLESANRYRFSSSYDVSSVVRFKKKDRIVANERFGVDRSERDVSTPNLTSLVFDLPRFAEQLYSQRFSEWQRFWRNSKFPGLVSFQINNSERFL